MWNWPLGFWTFWRLLPITSIFRMFGVLGHCLGSMQPTLVSFLTSFSLMQNKLFLSSPSFPYPTWCLAFLYLTFSHCLWPHLPQLCLTLSTCHTATNAAWTCTHLSFFYCYDLCTTDTAWHFCGQFAVRASSIFRQLNSLVSPISGVPRLETRVQLLN